MMLNISNMNHLMTLHIFGIIEHIIVGFSQSQHFLATVCLLAIFETPWMSLFSLISGTVLVDSWYPGILQLTFEGDWYLREQWK